MGVLAHRFEAQGLPTTQISLIREHTERLRPPRALWVSFPLGRPLGAPEDAAQQLRVLRHALALLEAPEGPVLVDSPEEAGEAGDSDSDGWACPIPTVRPAAGTLRESFAAEAANLLSFYWLAVERRGRTTVGLSKRSPAELLAFFGDLADPASSPAAPDAALLKHAAEDLKALYLEAATAKSASAPPDALERWFWRETSAGALLREVADRYASSADSALALVARLLLVPFTQR